MVHMHQSFIWPHAVELVDIGRWVYSRGIHETPHSSTIALEGMEAFIFENTINGPETVRPLGVPQRRQVFEKARVM